MTREEAKRRLLDIERCTPIHTREDARDFEALEMAIQALSQEQISLDDINNALGASFRNGVRSAKVEQEPCEDAISRKKAICVISACDGKSAQIESLEQLPSVTPSILKARWIKVTNGRGGHECSNCCEYAPNYKNGEEYLCRFCPDCGAEMESEE